MKVLHLYLTSIFTMALPKKLKEFCEYSADLSYIGLRTFPVSVQFDAQKRDTNGAASPRKWTRSFPRI